MPIQSDGPTGEVLPADAQAILRDNSEAQKVMRRAGLDLDYFAAEIIRARAEWSSIAAWDLSEASQGGRLRWVTRRFDGAG